MFAEVTQPQYDKQLLRFVLFKKYHRFVFIKKGYPILSLKAFCEASRQFPEYCTVSG